MMCVGMEYVEMPSGRRENQSFGNHPDDDSASIFFATVSVQSLSSVTVTLSYRNTCVLFHLE